MLPALIGSTMLHPTLLLYYSAQCINSSLRFGEWEKDSMQEVTLKNVNQECLT